MWRLLLLAGIIFGVYEVAKPGEAEKKPAPTPSKPKRKERTPFKDLPEKIKDWDDMNGARKAGWKDGLMPKEFRHYYAFVDGAWKEITREEWDYFFMGGGNENVIYKRKQAYEEGKRVWYKEIEN